MHSIPPASFESPGRSRWWRGAFAAAAAVVILLAGCIGDVTAAGATETTATADTTTADTTGNEGSQPDDGERGPEQLHILVSNDDSYAAPGIDALVEGLLTIEGVEVTVVAPADERSGTGGSSTEGPLEVTEVELASGHPARAVDGFPADAVRVAIDDLGIEPHVVITGINAGQNLGPIIDISGTVGAARAAVARDVPALATSQGWEGSHDAELEYRTAVSIVIDWVQDNRDALVAGEMPVEVLSLNVPSGVGAAIRGLAEVEPDLEVDPGEALAVDVDCTSTVAITDLPSDVAAFNHGYATIGVVPDEPAVTTDAGADDEG